MKGSFQYCHNHFVKVREATCYRCCFLKTANAICDKKIYASWVFGIFKHVLSLTKLLESYFESCPITNLLTFLSFNLFKIERVSHGSSKLPKLHVSSSKMALSKYTPLGVEFVLKKFYLNRLYSCLLRFFFQILKNVDHPCTNGDLESFYCQSK